MSFPNIKSHLCSNGSSNINKSQYGNEIPIQNNKILYITTKSLYITMEYFHIGMEATNREMED